MNKKIWTLAALTLVACSPKLEKQNTRFAFSTEIERHEGRLDSPLATSVENDRAEHACSRINALTEYTAKAPEGFSLFAEISKDETEAKMRIAENHFAQMVLGEQFVLDSEDKFYEKVEEERAKGNISGLKMFFVKVLKFVGMMEMAQYPATNDKIQENFPGVFGEAAEFKKSLFYKLALRAAKEPPSDLRIILSQKTPLFAGSTWQDFADDSRLSLAAAIRAFKSEDQQQRACGYVLLQRSFAQLLALKGFRAPKIKNGSVEKISKPDQVFAGGPRAGAFVDANTGKAEVLTPELISGYDPEKSVFRVRATVPALGSNESVGELHQSLAMMEALLFHFEATSPASPWVEAKFERDRIEIVDSPNESDTVISEDGYLMPWKKEVVKYRATSNYLLGDISAETSSAILPDKANSLALGLLGIHFKNLAAAHIKKVNLKGALVRGSEKPAGFVLSESGSDTRAEVRLESALRLTRVAAYLEGALSRFNKHPRDVWESLNPAYTEDTLNSLLGDGVNPGLRDQLLTMKFPLAILVSEFVMNGRCAAKLEWDLVSGVRVPTAECTPEQQKEVADTLETLGRSAQSSILLRKADDLRRR